MLIPVSAQNGSAPEITVIIPTYNRKVWLRKAVDSVLDEMRVPLVVHIFDNASIDGTEEYIRELVKSDARVRYTRHELNRGPLRNYDSAFRAIDSPFFVPLADDDLLLPNFLYDAYEIIRRAPDLGAVVFQTEHLYPDGTVGAINPSPSRASGRLEAPHHLADWMEHGHYEWSSILWNRRVLERVGMPEVRVGLANDVDFQAQVFCHFPVVRVLRAGAVYRVHGNQASHGVLSGNWRLIIRRLDLTVRLSNVLAWKDYLYLRATLLRRWKNMCRGVLNGKSWRFTLKAAWSLGLRFPDFGFAASLLLEKMRASLAIRTRIRQFCSDVRSL